MKINKLLKKEIISQFDYIKTKKNLENLLTKISMLEFKYINIKFPTITPQYEFRYECFTNKKVDKVGNYVETKLDTEAEVDLLYATLSKATKLLTDSERYYFVENMFNNISEETIASKLNLSRTGFIPIKESCVIKIALSLGIAVKK